MLTVEYLSTPDGDYILQDKAEARDQREQAESLLRQSQSFWDDGMAAEAEAEGAGATLLEKAANLRVVAKEMKHRQEEEEKIREIHGAKVKRAAFETEPISLPMREKLQAAIDADPKGGKVHAQAALDLLFPGGVKAPAGWIGEISEELLAVLKGRAMAEFCRPPSEERRAFLLGSAGS